MRQISPEFVGARAGLLAGYYIGEQLTVTPHDGGAANAGMLQQGRFHFARFDAVAADLELLVDPAQEFDFAVGAPAYPVTGAVHPRCGFLAERVVEKALGREFRSIQVAAGDAGTADVQLSGQTDRQRVPLAVENIATGVVDRASNRRRSRRIRWSAGVPLCRVHGDLGRPIGVEHGHMGSDMLQPEPQIACPQGFPAQNAAAKTLRSALSGANGLVGQQAPQGLGHIERGHRIIGAAVQEPIGIDIAVGVQHQCGTATQCALDFLDRCVECHGGQLQQTFVRTQSLVADRGEHQVHCGAMLHQHPFRRAGGARCVDRIGQVLRSDRCVGCVSGQLGDR